MMPDRDRYQALLESLADGAEVDWAALDSSAATSAERQRYRNLRLVARVAELHRTLTLDEEALFPALERDVPTGLPPAWGHLHVGERIASGAYGEIYVAHDPQLNRDVALKILRRGAATGHSLDQLLVEARTLAKVRHGNVVTIHGAEVRDGQVGLWMELIHGQTLETWLRTHGTMGGGEAGALGVDVCRAVAAVHAAGLVHGDIKAQNVMREDGGRLVLMDFGAGRAQGSIAANVAGTPMYLAPEVLAGAPPTPRSDIYSVGVLLFHLLTGGYPCTADDLNGLRAAHANGSRAWLRDLRPDLPDHLVEAIERALDPDPAGRFATAGEMEHAVGRVSEPVPFTGWIRNRARWIGFATAAAAFLAVVAALIVWSHITESRRGVVLSEVRTIGVLPMKDLTDSAVPERFAEGLTDELIATLGQVKGLTIKPASSGGAGDGRSLQDIARALDVDALLETTLSRDDGGDSGRGPGRLRVRAKLIAAGSQQLIWSSPSFDRPRGATLELPGALAVAIAHEVHAAVSPAESSRLHGPGQTSPAAEEAYLQGRAHLEQYGGGSADQALKAFQKALQLDPKHTGAHSGAARAYVILGVSGIIPNAQARAAALQEAHRALAVDQDLAEPHATLAYLSFLYDWDWPEAEREFSRSLELNPNSVYARSYYAEFLAAQHRFDEARAQADTAKRLAPQSSAAARGYAVVLYYLRDFDGAERALDEARAIEPNNAALPVLESRLREARGLIRDALDITTKAVQLSGGGNVPLRVQQIRQQALAGLREDAAAGLKALQKEAALGRIRLTARDLGYIYLAFGDEERSIEQFSEAVAEQEPTVVWLSVDPRVEILQDDPRFRKVLLSIGLPLVP
jgi:serine/threonine-protein kinase